MYFLCTKQKFFIKQTFIKGSQIRDTETLNFSFNIVSLQVLGRDVSHFSPCVINLSRNKNVCCRLKKVVAKSRAQFYFEQQILALLLVFHQRNSQLVLGPHPGSKSTMPSVHCISSTRNKCFFCATSRSPKVKNVKHRPKIGNETMLRG